MITIAGDSQILNTVQMCGRKTELEFIQNYRPHKKPEAFEKGDLMHKMLAVYYYARILNPQPHHLTIQTDEGPKPHPWVHLFGAPPNVVVDFAVEVARRALVEMNIPVSVGEENIKVFKQYILHHQRDGWTVLEVEQPFSRLLYERPDTPEREGIRILYEGIIDLIAQTPHGPVIVDHKTASRRSHPYKMANQFLGYCWALGVQNVIINRVGFQTSLKPEEKFQRIWMPYERDLIHEWTEQAIYWFEVLAGYRKAGYFPPNFTSCDKYSGCIFQAVCATIPRMREFKLQSYYFVGKPWSPHTRDNDNG